MERLPLQDFHPYDTGLDQPVRELAREYGPLPASTRRVPCGRDAFLALLAGVPALRKTPGIPHPSGLDADYFTTLPQCPSAEDAAQCQAHLEKVFGIRDKDSLLEFCTKELRCQNQYLDFEGFWEGRPPFDLSHLKGRVLDVFQVARDFSAQFYDVTQRRGYLAWDISECMGHLRAGLACGLLGREEFDQLAEYWAVQAQAFHSWTEYAVSLVCGALYWDFRHGSKLPELQKGLELWLRLVRQLLDNESAWGGGMWYVPPRKKDYLLWEPELRLYLPRWEGPNGCFATNHITVLGKKVRWCYREKPDGKFPDSGWRFFSGEEDDGYVNDLAHTEVYELNTICNYDPGIIPLLDAPYGSAFSLGEDGVFHAEPFPTP